MIHTYSAGDYAGIEAGKLKVYYGYEQTLPVRVNGEYEDEWCCVIWKNGKEVFRMPNSQLLEHAPEESPIGMLVAGLTMYLSTK